MMNRLQTLLSFSSCATFSTCNTSSTCDTFATCATFPICARPYTMVEGLRTCAVTTHEQLERLLGDGARCRTVAATGMNSQSSRAHTVVQLKVGRCRFRFTPA